MPSDRENLPNDNTADSETLNFTSDDLLDDLIGHIGLSQAEPQESEGWFTKARITERYNIEHPDRPITPGQVRWAISCALEKKTIIKTNYKHNSYFKNIDKCNIV